MIVGWVLLLVASAASAAATVYAPSLVTAAVSLVAVSAVFASVATWMSMAVDRQFLSELRRSAPAIRLELDLRAYEAYVKGKRAT